jgi:hypothetical protein
MPQVSARRNCPVPGAAANLHEPPPKRKRQMPLFLLNSLFRHFDH